MYNKKRQVDTRVTAAPAFHVTGSRAEHQDFIPDSQRILLQLPSVVFRTALHYKY